MRSLLTPQSRLGRVKVTNLLRGSMGAVFLLTGLLVVLLVRTSMRQQALSEARSKALLILEHNLATHTYYSHQLKPALFALVDPEISSVAFDPVWMSSTYAVREIDKYFLELDPLPYYYKECAISARSPENEADTFERAFIERLNTDPNLMEESLVRNLEGQPTFVTLRRGEVMEEACLQCHSTPDAAPTNLVATYGAERSFGRQVGEVVSAISIRVPLSDAYANADRLSLQLSLLLVALLVALYIAQWVLTRQLFVTPIDHIRQTAVAIANDPARIGEQIPLPPGRELQELTAAFDTMSSALEHSHEALEAQVETRTADLLETNARLEAEIALRRQIEATLRESEERYRTVFETSGTAMLISRADTTIMLVNAELERLTGYSREALEGKRSWREFVSDVDLARLQTYHRLRNADPDAAPSHYEFHIVDKAGETKAVFASVSTIPGTDRTVCSLLDITERQELQKILEAHTQQLEQMVNERTAALSAAQEQLIRREKLAVLGQMAGGISHELRGPLGNIRNSAYYLALLLPDADPSVKETLDVLDQEVARADSIIRSLLTFTRNKPPELHPVDINTLVVTALSQVAIPEPIRLETALAAGLPLIQGDAQQLTSVFRNLANNAVQAMADGGILMVSTAHNGQQGEAQSNITVTVADTGVGISADDLARLFEPLFTTKPGGIGLGLPLAQTIVEAHGGEITVQSAAGEGTTFLVNLPAPPLEAT